MASAIFYAVLREQYRVFYQFLHIAPEDVGLTSAQILIESATGVAILFVAGTVAMMLLLLAGFVLGILNDVLAWAVSSPEKRAALHRHPLFEAAPSGPARTDAATGLSLREHLERHVYVGPATVMILVGAIAATLFVLRNEAGEAGRCAGAGGTVRDVSFLGFPLLGVRALEAEVTWLDPSPSQPQLDGRVLYLGQSDGTTVVYDALSFEPVRFPSSAASIRINRALPTCPSGFP